MALCLCQLPGVEPQVTSDQAGSQGHHPLLVRILQLERAGDEGLVDECSVQAIGDGGDGEIRPQQPRVGQVVGQQERGLGVLAGFLEAAGAGIRERQVDQQVPLEIGVGGQRERFRQWPDGIPVAVLVIEQLPQYSQGPGAFRRSRRSAQGAPRESLGRGSRHRRGTGTRRQSRLCGRSRPWRPPA